MNISGAFDAVTKAVAAAGAVAAIYAFITKNAGEVVPVVLTVSGIIYQGLLGVLGLVILALELRYWKGPIHRRQSYAYRVVFSRTQNSRFPTNWEILEQARRRDQVIALLFGVVGATVLGPIMYDAIRDDLSDGFPVDSWSNTWVSGCIALGVSAFVAGRILKSWLAGDRVPRRKQRCPFCGELCSKQARVCPHCQEWFPAWKLLSPSVRRGDGSAADR